MINKLVKHNLVDGIPAEKYEKDHLCSACEKGKMKKKSHKPKTISNSKEPLELLHMDLCGPMGIQSFHHLHSTVHNRKPMFIRKEHINR